MANEQDWRLTGQEDFLKGKTLIWKKYVAPRPEWDHDHCAFCWAKFMEGNYPDTLQEGYATEDDYNWICPQCFADFEKEFEWTVKTE